MNRQQGYYWVQFNKNYRPEGWVIAYYYDPGWSYDGDTYAERDLDKVHELRIKSPDEKQS